MYKNSCSFQVYFHLPRYNFKTSALLSLCKVSKGAKIRNRYNQEPHMTQDTNGKETNSQLDTTNESLALELICLCNLLR